MSTDHENPLMRLQEAGCVAWDAYGEVHVALIILCYQIVWLGWNSVVSKIADIPAKANILVRHDTKALLCQILVPRDRVDFERVIIERAVIYQEVWEGLVQRFDWGIGLIWVRYDEN
ncbi:hypothetical protein BO82DRAFT_397849 [Aspergillus uvarum CBS 121591]|uniref:Uncharacterized protein n=1 Tax=Aspergillus uvarum CBS 121591 TaxID=1448315 RepID=A0A319CNU1_9EURO|nr:hypothetical protein BO82DRAFT_397849 [Aspergillus uvarum CBS 121591]PYH86099.1 hypothetical protein BO82DRAFT_397849 [Aspergillus uvarum CBS 121591]